jgi:hypothetical protein
MVCFRVIFTSQKTRCVCISETDQSVPSKEVVSIIYFGSCKIHRKCFVGKVQIFLTLNDLVGIITTVLETLILLFYFCLRHQ